MREIAHQRCLLGFFFEEEEEFIYHKYTYTSNFKLIHVSDVDGLPEKQ